MIVPPSFSAPPIRLQCSLMAFTRPHKILYGSHLWSEELVFGDHAFLRALSIEVQAVRDCATMGEAMSLATTLTLTYAPGIPTDADELKDEGLTEADPYNAGTTGPACDGDWPPMPGIFTLETFDRQDAEAWGALHRHVQAEVVTTTFNGDYLSIQMSDEGGFLQAMSELKIPVERDDSVIHNLCMA